MIDILVNVELTAAAFAFQGNEYLEAHRTQGRRSNPAAGTADFFNRS